MLSDKLIHFISSLITGYGLTASTIVILLALYLVKPLEVQFYFYANSGCMLDPDSNQMSVKFKTGICYHNSTFDPQILSKNCMLTEICLSSNMDFPNFIQCLSLHSNNSVMVDNNNIYIYKNNNCDKKINTITIEKDCTPINICTVQSANYIEKRI